MQIEIVLGTVCGFAIGLVTMMFVYQRMFDQMRYSHKVILDDYRGLVNEYKARK